MRNLRRTARRHQGVNSEIWYEFPPGVRVMTPEGFEGVVTAVEDGQVPGDEQYIVLLDADMGGGEYDDVELKAKCTDCGEWFNPNTQDSDTVDLIPDDHAANEHRNAEIDAFHNKALGKTASADDYDGIVYQNAIRQLLRAGKATSYADAVEKYDHLLTRAGNSNMVEMSALRALLGTEASLHKTADEDQCPYDGSDSLMTEGLYTCENGDVWSPDDPAALKYHGDGPDRGHLQPRGAALFPEGYEEDMVDEFDEQTLHTASDDYPELASILVERPPLPHSTRVASLRAEAMPMIPPLPEWAVAQQFEQYPASGPDGISYFKGEIDSENHVDCLLYRKDGKLVGVLNHYPKDMGPERKGNVLLMVLPDYRQQGVGEALWREAVSRWNVKADGQDTSPDGAAFLNRISMLREAGFLDWALEPVADGILRRQEESGYGSYNAETGAMASYDWCRFRHNRHCFYPKALDEAASKQAGYAVWVPEDRGLCLRDKWDQQKSCPAPSEPGPKSGDPKWAYETWKTWEQGGQGRYAALGMPAMPPGDREARRVDQSVEDLSKKPKIEDPEAEEFHQNLTEVVQQHSRDKNPYVVSGLAESEFGFHLTAAWRDVQAKAKKIRAEGHVRIISASVEYLVGEVQGEHNVYQTSLMREAGTKKVALWECGCAWAAYSWGRSGRWKKFEGRLCSHALALNYEAQSRGWAGGNVTEDAKAPPWRSDNQKVIVPGDYQRGPIGEWRKASLRPKVADATFRYARISQGFATLIEAASWMIEEARQFEPRVTNLLRGEAASHNGEMPGLEHRLKTLDSLLDKMTRKGLDPRSLTEPFRKIKDVLRYTLAFPEPDWANTVQGALWAIQGRGFAIIEEENTWAPGDSYSGLQYNLQAPGSDLVFELQFHTTASFTLKQQVLHKMYEEFRNPSTPLARRQHLWDEMSKHWDNIPIPDHARDFAGEKFYPRPTASYDGTARPVYTDPDLAMPPAYAMVRDMLADGDQPGEVISLLAAFGVANAPGIFAEAMAPKPFKALVRGTVTEVLDLLDGQAQTRSGLVPISDIVHPNYTPRRGLASKTAAEATLEIILWQNGDLWEWACTHCGEGPPTTGYRDQQRARENGEAHAMWCWDLDWDDNPAVRVDSTRYAAKSAAADSDGYMVAIEIPEAAKTALHALCTSLYGDDVEEAENYHLTVVYPGPEDEVDAEALSEATLEWAERWGPMTGNISGFGVFHQTNGDKVLYASVNVPGLDRARNDLVDLLSAKGIALPDDYGYTPHLTLGYFGEADTPTPPEQIEDAVITEEFPIDSVTLALGGNWHSIPLTSEPIALDKVAGIDGAADAIAEQFAFENPASTEGCDICGDSGHTTAAHEAHPETYDDINRVAAGATFKVCIMGHVGITLLCNDPVVREGLTYEEAQEIVRGRADVGPEFVFAADLHEQPEPALPSTTGDEDDEDDLPQGNVADVVAAFQAQAGARLMTGDGGRPGASAGHSDHDIAGAAKQHLAKEALKAFSPAEQKRIIDEGEDKVAANLANLDITGTHYMSLEEAFQQAEQQEDDGSWLY